jgi:hypothetical protein
MTCQLMTRRAIMSDPTRRPVVVIAPVGDTAIALLVPPPGTRSPAGGGLGVVDAARAASRHAAAAASAAHSARAAARRLRRDSFTLGPLIFRVGASLQGHLKTRTHLVYVTHSSQLSDRCQHNRGARRDATTRVGVGCHRWWIGRALDRAATTVVCDGFSRQRDRHARCPVTDR